MATEGERKRIKLNRAGGSRAAVLPATWLERAGIRDEVVLIETDSGILVTAPAEATPSIEDDPAFPGFLAFLAQDALRNPHQLGDLGRLVEGDESLLEGVETDAA